MMIQAFNSSQLKNWNEYSSHATVKKFIGQKQSVEKFYFKKYNFCEYAKFGAISQTINILLITAYKVWSENSSAHMLLIYL